MKQAGPTVIAALVLTFGASSCADGTANDADTDAEPASGRTASGVPQRPRGSDLPGANGEVAAVAGKTMQVQSPLSGQVAVTWTAKTTFTHQVDASFSDIDVGDCVLVRSDDADEANGTSNGTSTEMDATTVRISAPVDGSCAPGYSGEIAPGGPSGPASGLSTEAPFDLPSDLPSDLLSGDDSLSGPGGPDGRGGAVGLVTATSPDGFVIESTSPAPPGDRGGSRESGSPPETTMVDVAVSAGTAFTTTAKTTSKAVKVGTCVDARGEADSTGSVTADTVSVFPKVDGQCGFVFGGRRVESD